MSSEGALEWRGAGVAGSGGRGAGAARRAGQVALTVRSEGCRGLRKVCGRALAKMRGLAGKEGGVFGRDAWAGMSRECEEAGGATGCGGLRAWGWPGPEAWARGLTAVSTLTRVVTCLRSGAH